MSSDQSFIKRKGHIRTVFLVMKDHPFGGEMLKRLVEAGFFPEAIIEEDSSVAVQERDKFRARMAGQVLPPTPAEVSGWFGIRLLSVADHNDEDCRRFVHGSDPDVILLGGTRILKGPLLDRLILNTHPGLLPWIRGSSPEAWSIYRDLPVGVTCHRVDAGVDTGPILLRRLLTLTPRLTYEEIVRQNVRLAAATMVDSVRLVATGQGEFCTQEDGIWKAHPVMPSDLLQEVFRKLAEGRYAPKALPVIVDKVS